MSETAVKDIQVKVGKVARYVYRHGIVIADDFMKMSMEKGVLPLEGSFVYHLKKPVSCSFITFGYGGVTLPDNGLCVVGDTWNQTTPEESFALHRLMHFLDPKFIYKIKSNWILLDMKETDARIIRRPTDREIVTIKKSASQMKNAEPTIYKAIKRIQRRRTTSGADIPDGHEGDSDRDPMEVYFNEMITKEAKYEKDRIARLAPWPDTAIGHLMHKAEVKSKNKRLRTDEDQSQDLSLTGQPQVQALPGQPPLKRRGRPPGKRVDKKNAVSSSVLPQDKVQVVIGANSLSTSLSETGIPSTVDPLLEKAPRKPIYEDLFGDDFCGEEKKQGETAICSESAIVQQRRIAASKRALPQGLPQTLPVPQPSETAIPNSGTVPLSSVVSVVSTEDKEKFGVEDEDDYSKAFNSDGEEKSVRGDDDYDCCEHEIDYGDCDD